MTRPRVDLLLTRRQLLASLSAAGAASFTTAWPAHAEPPPLHTAPLAWEHGWGGERARPSADDLAAAGGPDDDPLA